MDLLKRISCQRLGDLCGKVPDGHSLSKKTPRGFVHLAHGQVWVERSNDRLWKIQKVVHYGKSGRRRWITLVPYHGDLVKIEREESSLSRDMLVWDEAIAAKERFLARYWREHQEGHWGKRQFPTFPDLAQYLGFDPNTGCRID